MRSSRRAFLTGARNLADPWTRFCARLRRCVHGKVDVCEPSTSGAGRARLHAARDEDILHARALCAETGVVLALDGCPIPLHQRVVIVNPAALNAVTAKADGSVVAQTGATLGSIRHLAPGACPGGDDDLTLALWLAGCPPPTTDPKGAATYTLDAAEVMLASGHIELFGPFGAQTQRPPLSSAASSLVSQLFMLVNSGEVRPWRHLAAWPARYRLDALLQQEPNLAHVWHGSQGTLGWVLRAHLKPCAADAAMVDGSNLQTNAINAVPLYADGNAHASLASTGAATRVSPSAVHEFEDDVKQVLDPYGLFPRLPMFPVV